MRAIILILGVPIVFAACSDDGPGTLVCIPSQSVDVNYYDQGTFRTDTLKLGGVTVTGSNTIQVTESPSTPHYGLGVVGGARDYLVDGAEWLRFAIDVGAAVEIEYLVGAAGDGDGDNIFGEATVEGFDVAGTSLGTVPTGFASGHNVSAMFSDDTLSAFVVAAQDGDSFRFSSLTYTPCR